MATKATLVLCGTGKTGRRVVERLATRGIPTRVVRDPASRLSTGTTARPGLPFSTGRDRPTSRTTWTPARARQRRPARSPVWR
jgi:UDP-N-acetylmuramoylalanine-D-glutamate ligase